MGKGNKVKRLSSVGHVELNGKIDTVRRISRYTDEERQIAMMQIAVAERDRVENMMAVKQFKYDGDDTFDDLLEKTASEEESPAVIVDIGNHFCFLSQ